MNPIKGPALGLAGLASIAGVQLATVPTAAADIQWGGWACHPQANGTYTAVEVRAGRDGYLNYFYAHGGVKKVANQGSGLVCGHVTQYPGAQPLELHNRITVYKNGLVCASTSITNTSPRDAGFGNNHVNSAFAVDTNACGHGEYYTANNGAYKNPSNWNIVYASGTEYSSAIYK